MMAIGRRQQLPLAGMRIEARDFRRDRREGAAAFPLTEPTLLRMSLASRGGQSGRFLKGRV
jgi:hypothetical protein